VRSILEDSNGNLWFGSWSEGAARFDGDRLEYFTVDDGLSDNQIRSIHEDTDGTIWFEGGVGLSSYDGKSITRRREYSYTTRDDWKTQKGDLWFKGNESVGYNDREGAPGAYRYDGGSLVFLEFPLHDAGDKPGYYSITGTASGSGVRQWFATYGAVIGFDGTSFAIIDNESLGLTEASGFLHVRCVFEDSKGRLWIGNNGIGVILRDGDTTYSFTQASGLGRRDRRTGGGIEPMAGDATEGEPSLHRVFSIGEDAHGNIWFGTHEQGAWRYDGQSMRQFTEADGLATKSVMAIYTDSDGVLVLGGDGVYAFNGETFDRIH
jgi:hypothetical protein